MKKLFVFFYLTISVLALEKIPFDRVVTTSKEKVLLDSITQYAIRVGDGNMSKVYIFVDPMCRHSRKYITKIFQDKNLQKQNSYYIFLYKLPKYDSNNLSQYIYQSKDPSAVLEKVMVGYQDISLEVLQDTQKKQVALSSISKVAEELNIEIRPYIIKFEKFSKYCLVSSGVAPCMEEYDFE